MVGLHPLRPLAFSRAAARLFEQNRRPVYSYDAVSGTGEHDRVPSVAAGRVEHVRARFLRPPARPRRAPPPSSSVPWSMRAYVRR